MGNVLRDAIEPALALLPAGMDRAEAKVLMLAIGAHESKFQYTDQVDRAGDVLGPALGWWQFELGGGVRGVMEHPATEGFARAVCKARAVPASPRAAWVALKSDQVLAAAFARLLLFTDIHKLPALGAIEEAWQYYLRNWRPGAYTRGTPAQRAKLRKHFVASYAEALAEVQA